jgi:general secretion pathway protein I
MPRALARASTRARAYDEVGGFTLLEVMVAVAILGLSLTVILSAQVSLFSSGSYGQHVGIATGLVRCRMAEVEEDLLKLGFPEADLNDEGPCCMRESRLDMRCKWKVERVELPQPLGLNALGSSSVSVAGSSSLDLNSPSFDPNGALANSPAGGSALGALSQFGSSASSGPTGGAGIGGLSGMLAGAASGGTSGLASMVMGIVYPSLKPMLEASIRKVTVVVMWKEGIKPQELEVVQWLTNPMKANLLSGAIDPSASGSAAGGLPGLPGGLPAGLGNLLPGGGATR